MWLSFTTVYVVCILSYAEAWNHWKDILPVPGAVEGPVDAAAVDTVAKEKYGPY